MIALWLTVGSFAGAFSGVLVARALGAWVVRATFARLNRQLRARAQADEDAITPVEKPTA